MAPRDFWLRKARGLATTRNLAFVLDLFLPTALWLSVAASVVVIGLRAFKIQTAPVWWIFGGLMLVALDASWFMARRKFFTTEQSLVRLNEIGRMA